jgi:hypothetical protein
MVNINGRFSRSDLNRLSWPIAWDGTVSSEARAAYEAELAALLDEAQAALSDSPDAVAVEIVDGKVTAVIQG